MNNEEINFNKYPGSDDKTSQFTFAYNPKNQYEGEEKALSVDVEKANKFKRSVFKNILDGNAQLEKIELLIEKDKEEAIGEVLKALDAVKGKYIPDILHGVKGRIRYLLRIENHNTDAFQTFNEIDKIRKYIKFYQDKSPNDYPLQKEEVKKALNSIAERFDDLITLYQKKTVKFENPDTGVKINVDDKANVLSDKSFIQQATEVSLEANDLMMDIESMLVTESFSKIYKLLDDIRDADSKDVENEKVQELKTILAKELDTV